jgi:hypothetical protein
MSFLGHKINASGIPAEKYPDEWFMPLSALSGEHCRKYMDEEQRKKTLRDSLKSVVDQHQQARGKQGKH